MRDLLRSRGARRANYAQIRRSLLSMVIASLQTLPTIRISGLKGRSDILRPTASDINLSPILHLWLVLKLLHSSSCPGSCLLVMIVNVLWLQ